MKKLLVLGTLLLTAQSTFAGILGVYGQDDRKDVYQVTNQLHLKLAQATAGLVHKGLFTKGASSTLFDMKGNPTLTEAQNLCTSERFGNQLLAASCSGFLVGPDTLVTAGHCYKTEKIPGQTCRDQVWVFDYNMKSATTNPTKNISINNIYSCKSVAFAQLDNNLDYAIIKLDRKVVGRTPVKYRTTGKIADKTSLVVIGHPDGLPTKIAANGKVNYNAEPTRFATNLDTFHGNSGSAVFDSVTGQVEGILIMGKTDYLPSIPSNPKSCTIVNKCDDGAKNCRVKERFETNGEIVLRITEIQALIAKALAQK